MDVDLELDSWSDDDDSDHDDAGTKRTAPRPTTAEREARNAEWWANKHKEKRVLERARRKLVGRPRRPQTGTVSWHRPRVAVDLSFCDALPEKEARSVLSQVNQTYGWNRKSERPLELHLCATECPGAAVHLARSNGYPRWDVHRHREQSVLEAFADETQNIVILSPDSSNVLEDLDEAKIYVLGGIADNQNQMKGMTLARARELGVAHARLPLAEFFPNITKRGNVLNVNHCFQMLQMKASGCSWFEAIDRCLPTRATFRRVAPAEAPAEAAESEQTNNT